MSTAPSSSAASARALLSGVTRRRIRIPETQIEISLLDWGGDGPLALLHHANGFCGGVWACLVDALGDRFRFVAMEARGHGDSTESTDAAAFSWSGMADDVAFVAQRLCADLGCEQVALGLGHSFGGTLTLTAASRHPGLFERVVAVDPVIPPRMTPAEALEHSKGLGLADRARRRRSSWASRAEARAFFASKPLFESWDPRALDLYVSEGLADSAEGGVVLKCPGRVEGAIFGGSQSLDVAEAVHRLETPSRLLWARRGNFPRAIYESLIEGLADPAIADIVDLEAGHLAVMEDPALVANEVLRFSGAD